jgi:hypothetical protein
MKTLAFLLLLGAACAHTAPPQPPPRFADDAEHALAVARARKLPLVVDVWAPW